MLGFKANGKPHNCFDSIPVIPRLQAMSANSIHAKKERYRANNVHEPEVIKNLLRNYDFTFHLSKTIGAYWSLGMLNSYIIY